MNNTNTTNNFNILELANNIVSNSIEKYANNSYVMYRLHNYINNLPTQLENDLKTYEQRIERNDELTNELELFSKVFLTNNKYYYLPTNNTFYNYDGKTFSIIKEDDILHNLLSTISNEGKLIQWKYKTKATLIKQIKERHLFNTVPETYTIEKVTNFLQETLFNSKQEAKYFLTIIGDGLLRKQTNNMYFVSSNVKEFINYVNELIFAITRSYSYQSNFVSRYHNVHDITNYRLIPEKYNYLLLQDFNKALDNIFIDLLCVSTYYSSSYQSAENFIQTEAKDSLRDYTLFFTNKTVNNIVEDFVSNCFTKIDNNTTDTNINITNNTNTNNTISWQSMLRIWNKYLDELNIPNFIRYDNLKDILKTLLTVSSSNLETEDISFINITSKYMSTKQTNKSNK